MGNDMLSRRRLNEITQQGFIAARAQPARPEVAELIRRAAGR